MAIIHKMYSTTVKNTSAISKNFSFLPPHGRYMAAGEEYTFAGDLATVFGGNNKRRQRRALVRTIERGDLVVLETPNPIGRDTVDNTPHTIGVTNGNVVARASEGSSTVNHNP